MDGRLRCLEAETDVLVPSSAVLTGAGGLGFDLVVEEDVRLLLESTLALYGKFGGHDCGRMLLYAIAKRGSSSSGGGGR